MNFIKPCEGILTSGFRAKSRPDHYGVDITNTSLTNVEIKASASGTVSRSYTSSSYGEVIFILHNFSGQLWETVYAHMKSGSKRFREGQTVKQGEVIGLMGSTGQSFGQHLHFEIHKGRWNENKTNAVDPWPLINGEDEKMDYCTIQYKDQQLRGFIVDGVSYAPVRALAEMEGRTVSWNGKTKTVIVK